MLRGMSAYQVVEIEASRIVAGDNDRKRFTGLEELAASIADGGIDQPPTVRPLGDGRYELVMGERRTRAMRDVLGWETIPCIVRTMDDIEASAAMLRENTARADLDPVEEAGAYAKRLDAGETLEAIARTAGRSVATVRARVSLLRLSDQTLHVVRSGQIPLGHAVMMSGLDTNRQVLALKACDAQRLDAVSFGALCDRLMLEQQQEGFFDPDSFMRAEEYAADAQEVAAASGPKAELMRLRARLAELEERGTDLVGVQEIADMLGVQVRTVHMWQHRGRMPARDATVSGLPAWYRETVRAWARETGRDGR